MIDNASLKAAGVSHGPLGWLTNPLRQLLWPLVRPYLFSLTAELGAARHAGAVAEVALGQRLSALESKLAKFRADLAAVWPHLDEFRADPAALRERLEALEAQAAGAVATAAAATAAASIAATAAEQMRTELGAARQEASALVPAFGGVRRDLMATAHRLTSIELTLQAAELSPARGKGPNSTDLPNPALRLVTSGYGSFVVPRHDLIGDALARGEYWDPHLRAVIAAHANSDRIALDVGAYIGFHTVQLSRLFKAVHSFEPQQEIFNLLRTNLTINGCRNCHLIFGAAYDHAGFMQLAKPERQEIPIPLVDGAVDYASIGNAAALSFEPAEAGAVGAVPAHAIDDLGFQDVGFMKVDAQGSDLRALKGAAATIRRCRPAIAFEFELHLAAAHGDVLADYEAFFAELGYSLTVLDRRSEGKQTDYLALPGAKRTTRTTRRAAAKP